MLQGTLSLVVIFVCGVIVGIALDELVREMLRRK